MSQTPRVLVVYITTRPEDAEALARALVETRVASGVNIVPQVRSIYRWKNTIHDESEALLLATTTEDRFEALKEMTVHLHKYEVPEIIAVPVSHGHPPFLQWAEDQTRGAGS